MKATSASPRSRQQAAGSSAVVFLHGHQLDRNLARAATAEAAGTFVLVLAITSAAVAATLSRPGARTPYGSLAVPVAGGLALAIAVASIGHTSGAPPQPGGDPRAGRQQPFPVGLRSWLRPGPVRRRDSGGRGHLGPVRRPGPVDRPPWRHRPGRRGVRGAGPRGRSRCHLRAGPGGSCGTSSPAARDSEVCPL